MLRNMIDTFTYIFPMFVAGVATAMNMFDGHKEQAMFMLLLAIFFQTRDNGENKNVST